MTARSDIFGAILFSTTALGLSMPALAQDPTGAQPGTTSTAGTPPQPDEIALANEVPDDGTIIVTARRVEENLQDVPISITVFNQEQITNRNIVIASDLGQYTPSLSVNQRFGPEKASFSIRGFNQESSTAPTVGVYFADVVGVRAQGGTQSGSTVGAGAFMDLQNVQVLKGPQGTLFGRNTTGGAVLLVPNKPSDRFEGYVEGQVGDYDLRRVMGVVNVPLADTFKVRASFDRNTREGFMRNRSGIGPKDYNNVDYWAGRLSVVAELTPNLENYTIASYSRSHNNGYAARITLCDQTAARNTIRGLTSYAACDQIARQNARGDSLYDVEVSDPNPGILIETWQIINTTTWQASDALTIKNIASYGEFKERSFFNLYSDNFSISASTPNLILDPRIPALPLRVGAPFRYIELEPAANEDTAHQSSFTEELQLQGRAFEGKLNFVVGGYLEFSRPEGFSAGRTGIFLNCTSVSNIQGCATPIPLAGTVSNSRTKLSFDNHGIFGQATYNFTDQLALTLGGRYTFDKIKGYNESTRISPQANGTNIQFCNDTFRFRDPGSTRKVVQTPSQCGLRLGTSSKEPTWLIDVDYKPNEDILLYAKYARGYRQGGLSFTNVALETWGPEQIDAYEVGTKISFGGPLRGFLNITGFYNDLKDQQIFGATLARPEASGQVGAQVIINAGKSTSKGIEVDAGITPVRGLRFDLGYTYLDTELKELIVPSIPADSPFVRIIPNGIVGAPSTLSPKHRITLNGSYTLPLAESVGRLTVGATYVHTSRQVSNFTAPVEIGVIPNYGLLNLNANWDRVFGSPVDAAFFMTNVTNKTYSVNTGGAFPSAGIGDILLGAPKMYGFRLRVNFGG